MSALPEAPEAPLVNNNGHASAVQPFPWTSFLLAWPVAGVLLFVSAMCLAPPTPPHHPKDPVASALLSGFEEFAILFPTGTRLVYKRLARPVLVHAWGLPMPEKLQPRASFPPIYTQLLFTFSVALAMLLILYGDKDGRRLGLLLLSSTVIYNYVLPRLV